MQQLTIRHLSATGKNKLARVHIAFQDADGSTVETADGSFLFTWTDGERRDIRWYLEEYIQFPHGEFKTRAEQTEAMLQRKGAELFDAAFGDERRRALFDRVADQIPSTRFVIETTQDNSKGTALPWELLRDPRREDGPIALRARSFLRSQPDLAPPEGKHPETDTFNILMIISRPEESSPLPYLADVGPLLELFRPHRDRIRIDVLRPPTFQQLQLVLSQKRDYYHVLHFDGHGVFAPGLGIDRVRKGALEGMLLFENDRGGPHPVSGMEMRQILVYHPVPVIILGACQSAMQRTDFASPSVAHRLLRTGAGGVVAMAYSVYVSTATRFMARFYQELLAGHELGGAFQRARVSIARDPERPTRLGKMALQDWIVPLLFEAEPVRPFSAASVALNPSASDGAPREPALLHEEVGSPLPPRLGFVGRDQDLLMLDRILRTEPLVLLRGMAGVGKSEAALGFARWWVESGGFENHPNGRIFYFSLAQTVTLTEIVDRIDETFRALRPTEEYTAEDTTPDVGDDDPMRHFEISSRQTRVINLLKTTPCLLILDNIDLLTPETSTLKAGWIKEEKAAIARFLQLLRSGKTKVLITSRSPEPWLGNRQAVYRVDGLEFPESAVYAEKLLKSLGVPVPDTVEYRRLLSHLAGNTDAIQAFLPEIRFASPETVLVSLQQGDLKITDATQEQKRAYLWISGLPFRIDSFSEDDRKRIYVLALFRGYVNPTVLAKLSEREDAPDFLRSVTVNEWVRVLKLLESAGLAAKIPQLVVYELHPATALLFRKRLAETFAATPDWPESALALAYREQAASIAGLMKSDVRQIASVVSYDETNLRHQIQRSYAAQAPNDATVLIEILSRLWAQVGRWDNIKTIADALRPHACDTNGEPMPGCEPAWCMLLHLDSQQAEYRHDIGAQETIDRRLATHYASIGDTVSRAAVICRLGRIALERRDYTGADYLLRESLGIQKQSGDTEGQTETTFRLGLLSYAQREFEVAEFWYRSSFGLAQTRNDLVRQALVAQELGVIAEERMQARLAERFYEQSLALQKQTSNLQGQALSLHRLGGIAIRFQRFSDAESRYRESLTIREQIEDRAGQAITLLNMGTLTQSQKQYDEAERWFRQALEIYRTVSDATGESAATHALGALAHVQGEISEAEELYWESIVASEKIGNDLQLADTLHQLALLTETKANLTDALFYLHRAIGLFTKIGAPQQLAMARETLVRFQRLGATILSSPVEAPVKLTPLPDDDLLPLPMPGRQGDR